MHYHVSTVLMIFISFTYAADAQNTSPDTVDVTTTNGVLRGHTVALDDENTLETFLGVPYATPPLGALRWARPIRHGNWTGERSAMEHGHRCLERVIPEDPVTPDVEHSEDCLYLDVYSFRSPNRSALRPTMMYIHGGGYYGGTGGLYNFTNVAAREVVVVTINYRLDVFGFLSNSDDVIPGNYGMLDQALALTWVRENIEAFGGDPNDVTMFGGSAGASSIGLMTLSPLTRGMFHKAILQSGAGLSFWGTTPTDRDDVIPHQVAETLAAVVGCTTLPSAMLGCLRTRSAEAIINASVAMQIRAAGASLWLPVVEKTFGFLPDTPLRLLSDVTSLVSIPTVRGYNHNEMAYLVKDLDDDGLTHMEFQNILKYFVHTMFYKHQDEIVRAIIKQYLGGKDPKTVDVFELRSALVTALTDAAFVTPAAQEAKMFSRGCHNGQAGSDQFLYDFDHRPSFSMYPQWMGIVHADEKGFVLGLPGGPDPFSYPSVDAMDEEISDLIVEMWTNFAKQGYPSTKGSNVTWHPYAKGGQCNGSDQPEMNMYDGSLFVIKNQSVSIAFDRPDSVSFWAHTIPDIAFLSDSALTKANYVNMLVVLMLGIIIC